MHSLCFCMKNMHWILRNLENNRHIKCMTNFSQARLCAIYIKRCFRNWVNDSTFTYSLLDIQNSFGCITKFSVLVGRDRQEDGQTDRQTSRQTDRQTGLGANQIYDLP